jgi:MFS family permease
MIVLWAPQAGRIAQKYGSRWPMTLGLLAAGASLFAFTTITATTSYWLVIAPLFVVMGLGLASVMTPMTAAVMGSVGPQRAGLGAAMTNTSREIGGAFGIALLGTLLTTRIKSQLSSGLDSLHLTPSHIDAIKATAGHGEQVTSKELAGLSQQQVGGVYHALSNAFLSGFHLALAVAAVVLFVASFVAWKFIPSGAPRHDGPHPGGDKPATETEAEAAAETEAEEQAATV